MDKADISVVYYSRYYNIQNFISFYMDGETCYPIQDDGSTELPLDNNCVLIIPTYEPEYLIPACKFLAENSHKVKAIIGSGDRNYSELYLYSVVEMATQYNIPIIGGFDGVGTAYEACIIKGYLGAVRNGETDLTQYKTIDIDEDVASYLKYKEMSGHEWINLVSEK